MLIAVTLILLALTVYNNKVIDAKSSEVEAIHAKQKATQETLDRISIKLNVLNIQIEQANKSYESMMKKIEMMDKKKSNYTEEVRKIKDANEETKEFLDRRLPADVKRLLDDAVSK